MSKLKRSSSKLLIGKGEEINFPHTFTEFLLTATYLVMGTEYCNCRFINILWGSKVSGSNNKKKQRRNMLFLDARRLVHSLRRDALKAKGTNSLSLIAKTTSK